MTLLTLKTFFCDDPTAAIYGHCDTTAAEKAVDAAMKTLPKPLQSSQRGAVRNALDEVFNVPLGDVLQASWKKLTGVQEALEATRLDPAKVVFVPLLEHKITSKHQPHIDLLLAGKSVSRLVLDIVLALELKSVELEVRDGRIAGLRSGQCGGNGVFAFEGQDLIKKATPSFGLPGKVAFAAA